MQQFQTLKSDLTQSRIIDAGNSTPLREGEVRLKIERFAFTANNITYAVTGDVIKYWEFFPTSNAEQWGMIPVWGFAVVAESNHPQMSEGDRYFGFLPPATQLVVAPSRVSEHGFTDSATHRTHLPSVYNDYRRVNHHYQSDDDAFMLLYPLHMTGFVIHAMLQANHWYGAEQIVILSASSKTSMGLAYALAEDASAPKIIGLTSAHNVAIITNTQAYDAVFSYDDLSQIDAHTATAIVDMSANGTLLGKLHQHLGDNMRFTSQVGLTHWTDTQPSADFISARSEQFFAPTHIANLIKKIGAADYHSVSQAFLKRSIGRSQEWLNLNELDGLAGLSVVYPQLHDGSLPADKGIVVAL